MKIPSNKNTPSRLKSAVMGVALSIATLGGGLLLVEAVIRVKNSSMKNYDIEMWRYSKELKVISNNPVLGHEHRPSASAVLQSQEIRTNDWGLRGGPVTPDPGEHRRLLVLGSSVTLGWGVSENETLCGRLQQMFEQTGHDVEVLNGGIGNYNAVRYVELFMTRLRQLQPTDVLVHYFIRDAEVLDPPGGNWLLRNSELAVTAWSAMKRFIVPTGQNGLEDHYHRVYQPDAPGFQAMKDSLKRLSDYAKANNIRLYLAITPDVHNLKNYPYQDIHQRVRAIAQGYGYACVDLYPALAGLDPREIWAMPGDPHPNSYGHELMARAIFPLLMSDDPSLAAANPSH